MRFSVENCVYKVVSRNFVGYVGYVGYMSVTTVTLDVGYDRYITVWAQTEVTMRSSVKNYP